MDNRFECFSSTILGVMLDALACYLKTTEQRKKDLLGLKAKYEKRLEHYVVMAQLDAKVIDIRDETNLTLELILKKLECFEAYLKDAEGLYEELFAYLWSKN